MKNFYTIIAATLMAAIIVCCNQLTPVKKQKNITIPVLHVKKEIEVRSIGEVRTRRTFADIQFMDNEKEQDRYIAKQEKSNPTVDNGFTAADSLLVDQFRKIGLIKGDEYLEKKFKPLTKKKTSFIDSEGRLFPITFFDDSLTRHTHFNIFFSRDSIDIDTNSFYPQDLNYAFLDVIPGGNKELVFLDDYYIMNGYNFDLKVYEIKSN